MHLIVKTLIIVSLLAILSGALVACSARPVIPTASANYKAPSTVSGVFKVTSLALNPTEVNTGVEALITAKVTNTGSREDSYQGRIKITNATQSSLPTFLPSNVVKIEAGNTQLISIPTVINQPGTYKVSWDNLDQILVVNPGETAASVGSPAAVPASAPDFTAVDVVTGKNVSLSQYKGTAILLNLVNYGCNPSTNQKVGAQLFAIKQLQSQRSDFIPISVFCGCCPPDVLRQFARENNLDWPWVLDSNYSIAAKYAGSLKHFGYPTLIFIDKSQLVTDVTGLTDPAGLNQKIDAITQDQSK